MAEKLINQQDMDLYFWGKTSSPLKEDEGVDHNVLTNRMRYKYLKRPTDLIIRKNVLNELVHDPELENNSISVFVSNGVVKLIGTVSAYWDMMIAEEDAYKVRGVFDVKNELTIS